MGLVAGDTLQTVTRGSFEPWKTPREGGEGVLPAPLTSRVWVGGGGGSQKNPRP